MRKQIIDFRKEDVTYIMRRWSGAESVSLIGVGSIGKSNLIHHLSDRDVQQHYLKLDHPDRFRAVVIDPNMLGPLPGRSDSDEQFRCWAGYELLLHRLYIEFYPFEILGDDADSFYELYGNLQNGNNPLFAYMGLRYLEIGIDMFMRRGVRIVFMFDEFELLLREMPVKFFLTLRGLRDAYKSSLSYLAFSRLPLPVLVERNHLPESEIEPFIELFTDNTFFIGPYNDTDARNMVNGLTRRNQRSALPDHIIDFLLAASGRFAGILRASYRMLGSLGDISPGDEKNERLITLLASREPVRTECETIWNGLLPLEQRVLKMLIRQIPMVSNHETDEATKLLVQKRLVHVDSAADRISIVPPVFRVYVSEYARLGADA